MAKIVIVSDLHCAPKGRADETDRTGRKLMQDAQPLLERLIEEINQRIHPDFVMNLGDLVQDYGNVDEDVAAMQHIWKQFDRIGVPHYTCVGNHDLRATRVRRETAKALGYEDSTYSFDAAGLHVVVLGTDVDYEAKTAEGLSFEQHWLSSKDLKWLAQDLEETSLPAIICLHFGVAEDDQKGNYWFGVCPEEGLLGNRRELKAICKRSGKVRAVFAGHQHWTKKIVEEGIPYYLVGSMTENSNGDGVPDGVYVIAQIDGESVKVREERISLA